MHDPTPVTTSDMITESASTRTPNCIVTPPTESQTISFWLLNGSFDVNASVAMRIEQTRPAPMPVSASAAETDLCFSVNSVMSTVAPRGAKSVTYARIWAFSISVLQLRRVVERDRALQAEQ